MQEILCTFARARLQEVLAYTELAHDTGTARANACFITRVKDNETAQGGEEDEEGERRAGWQARKNTAKISTTEGCGKLAECARP